MATSKPISSISFNTLDFLLLRLQDLLERGYISYFCLISHHGEYSSSDEVLGKDHFHVLLEPNKPLDLLKTQIHFTEPLPGKLPLRCLPFRKASLMDWYLYSAHYPDYLKSKQLEREFTYSVSDFISSDLDWFHHEWVAALSEFKNGTWFRLLNAAENHVPFPKLVSEGVIPVSQIRNAQITYDILLANFSN